MEGKRRQRSKRNTSQTDIYGKEKEKAKTTIKKSELEQNSTSGKRNRSQTVKWKAGKKKNMTKNDLE